MAWDDKRTSRSENAAIILAHGSAVGSRGVESGFDPLLEAEEAYVGAGEHRSFALAPHVVVERGSHVGRGIIAWAFDKAALDGNSADLVDAQRATLRLEDLHGCIAEEVGGREVGGEGRGNTKIGPWGRSWGIGVTIFVIDV